MASKEIRVIKSKQEYESALAEAEVLIDKAPSPGTREADRLELLALVIRHYEEDAYKIEKPGPVEAIMFRMEQMGLTRRDLEKYIGGRARVSEVLSGKRGLSLTMIRALYSGLKIPAETLIGRPAIKSKKAIDDGERRRTATGGVHKSR